MLNTMIKKDIDINSLLITFVDILNYYIVHKKEFSYI